jgi:hypothetical protein
MAKRMRLSSDTFSGQLLNNVNLIHLTQKVDYLARNFEGNVDDFNSAVGFLFSGYYYGWRFLYLAHSKRTVRKYEQILEIKVRDFFDQTGQFSYRSVGLNHAVKYPNYWKLVSGDIPIPDRKSILTHEKAKQFPFTQ